MYIVSDIRLKSSKESLIDKFDHVIFGKDVMAKGVFNLDEDEIRYEFQEGNSSLADGYYYKSEPDVVPLAVSQDFMDGTTLLPMTKLSDTADDGIDSRELSLEESLYDLDDYTDEELEAFADGDPECEYFYSYHVPLFSNIEFVLISSDGNKFKEQVLTFEQFFGLFEEDPDEFNFSQISNCGEKSQIYEFEVITAPVYRLLRNLNLSNILEDEDKYFRRLEDILNDILKLSQAILNNNEEYEARIKQFLSFKKGKYTSFRREVVKLGLLPKE